MRVKNLISLEKAAELVKMCECCNTIIEIVTALERYNIINCTDYGFEVEYKLYTTNDCGRCNLVKNMIKGQNLNIIVKEASEQDIKYLTENGNSGFPVLEIKAGEKTEFVDGIKVGEFIALNLEKFK